MAIPKAIFQLPIFLAILGSSSCVTRRAVDFLTVPHRATDGAHWEKEAKARPVRFEVKAADGVALSCLTLESKPGVKKIGTAYLLHGLSNSKEQMLPTARHLSDAGFRCVAWDSRAHGKSGGVHASYGSREVDDALRVIRAARKLDRGPRGEEVFWAYSMGTAVTLQTLPQLPGVKAAVLLAPIADLGSVIRYQAGNHYHGALVPLVPVVRAGVRSAAGFDPKSIRPMDSVKRTNCKLLLIHGDRDESIPPFQSQLLLDASAPGQTRRILLPGVPHHGVMWDLPEKTREEAVRFLVEAASQRAAAVKAPHR